MRQFRQAWQYRGDHDVLIPGSLGGHSVSSNESYVKKKVKILRDEFMIQVTDDDISAMRLLSTTYDVDQYCRKLLKERL